MVMKVTMVVKLVVCLALTFSAALLGSLFTRNAIADWYANLNKPSFTPPGWLFGPVWTALYVLMAVSAAIVWHKGLDKRLPSESLWLYFWCS